MPIKRTTVLVADEQPLFREALVRLVRLRPDFELVAEAADGPAALEAIESFRPDVALVSMSLPTLDGERVLNAVVRDELATRVLLLANRTAAEVAYRAIERGAAGCLTRDAERSELCDAIAIASRGEVSLGSGIHNGLAKEIRLRSAETRPLLSRRERQILRFTADGASNLDIARALNVSVPTVKTHVRHLYDKLGTSDRAAAVAAAMRRGLLE
jgi:two-component system nitrate/nitrite response regulator NarL